MNIIIELVTIFLWLLAIPFLTGSCLLRCCKAEGSPVLAYLCGMFLGWAVFEVIAAPCIKVLPRLGKVVSMTFVVTIWCVVMLLFSLVESYLLFYKKKYLVYRQKIRQFADTFRQSSLICKGLFLVMLCLIGFQMYMYFFYQHIDADDARFIANAVAAWDTDKMLLTHPDTGESWYWGIPIGELRKDAVSPWMVYIAMLAKLVRVHPAILAHTVFPVFLVGMGYGIYWLLGMMMLKQNLTKVFFFMTLVCLFQIFGYTSIYTSAAFFLTRIWQGKSVVAGLLLPFLLALMLLMEADYANKRWNIMLFLVNCASCLLSGMGLIFSALVTGCFVFVYALEKKSLKSLIYGALACVPNVIFGYIYISI